MLKWLKKWFRRKRCGFVNRKTLFFVSVYYPTRNFAFNFYATGLRTLEDVYEVLSERRNELMARYGQDLVDGKQTEGAFKLLTLTEMCGKILRGKSYVLPKLKYEQETTLEVGPELLVHIVASKSYHVLSNSY